MTQQERDRIIKLAHQAGCYDEQQYGSIWTEKLLRFAELVKEDSKEKPHDQVRTAQLDAPAVGA